MMSDRVNEMMVALSAAIPAAVLLAIISARKIAELLPQEIRAPVSKLQLSPLRFGWTTHFATAFLICSCVLAGLSIDTTGPSIWRGALAGMIASVVAFVLMPPLAETQRADRPIQRVRAWGISLPVLVVAGALLNVAYFVGPTSDVRSQIAFAISQNDGHAGPNDGG